MLAFANVFHFFTHELARLSGRRFAFTLVLARTFNWFFFWHNKIVSPLGTHLDVNKKAAGFTPAARLIPRRPVLSSALLAAARLTTTLFFTLALLTFTLLTFTLLSVAILLLPALLSRGGFARFVWILLCVHDAFLYYWIMSLGRSDLAIGPF